MVESWGEDEIDKDFVKEWIGEVDADGDGKVNYEEFVFVAAQMFDSGSGNTSESD